MKRLGLALLMLALVAFATPTLFSANSGLPGGGAETQAISQSCIQYCRNVCIAIGETCCFCGTNCCGCC